MYPMPITAIPLSREDHPPSTGGKLRLRKVWDLNPVVSPKSGCALLPPGAAAGVEGPGHPGILRGRAVAGGEESEGPWAPSDHQKLQKNQSGQVPRFWVRP